jgi:DNA primase
LAGQGRSLFISWDEVADVDPAALTIATVPHRFAELGDLHAGIDGSVFSIDQLLEWAERDERDGAIDLGDPEPPDN